MIALRSIRTINQTSFFPKYKYICDLHRCAKKTSYLDAFSSKFFLLTLNEDVSKIYTCNHFNVQLIDQKRFYTDINRKNLNYRIEKSKRLLTDNIEIKRLQIRERKEVFVQKIRDKKSKVQEKVERENILTIPNLLCVARSCLSPYIGYVIIQGHYQLAIGLLIFAGLTDLLDGFIARKWVSQASKLGSFLDPMADKLLVGSLVVSLSCCNLFPMWLSGMIISRDVFLIFAGFVIRYLSLPPPRTITRYFDATHVTAKLKPTIISKMNTAVQLITITASLAEPAFGLLDHSTLVAMWYFTGLTTVAAATSYILSKDTYQFIKDRKKSFN